MQETRSGIFFFFHTDFHTHSSATIGDISSPKAGNAIQRHHPVGSESSHCLLCMNKVWKNSEATLFIYKTTIYEVISSTSCLHEVWSSDIGHDSFTVNLTLKFLVQVYGFFIEGLYLNPLLYCFSPVLFSFLHV